MSDSVISEVPQSADTGRVGRSTAFLLAGLLLFVAAIALLAWNESRAVRSARDLAGGLEAVVPVTPGRVDPANEGRLVHVSGETRTEETLADPVFGISRNAIKLVREVEMYQWRPAAAGRTGDVRDGYEKVWDGRVIDSSAFPEAAGHTNPGEKRFLGERYDNRTVVAEQVMLGAFRLSASQIDALGRGRPLLLGASIMKGLPEPIRGPARAAGNHIYLGGDPGAPAVGDLRVSFRVLEPGPASVVAEQENDTLVPYRTREGRIIELVASDHRPAQAMFDTASDDGTVRTWMLRVAGALAMALGLALAVKPLSAAGVPSLNVVVGAGSRPAAFVVGGALSLLAMSAPWLTYRPLIAGALAGIAGLGVLGVAGARVLASRKRRAPIAPATPPAEPRTERKPAPERRLEKLLMRAMISAARAARCGDEDTKLRIARQAHRAGLTNREQVVLKAEMAKPWTVDKLAAACEDQHEKVKLYAASVTTIPAQNPVGTVYLRHLAQRLELSAEQVASVHEKLGR